VAWLVLLVVVTAVAYRLTTPDERQRYLERAIVVLRELIADAREHYAGLEPFRAALRARTPYVILIPALVAVNVALFMCMLFGAGSLSDAATRVGWGANYGPRTTNWEWWRLLTSTFIHPGFLRMVVDVAVLAQLGLLLERLVGRSALIAVYASAGVLASLINVSIFPMAVTAGPSGAIFGLYGLLLASIVRGTRDIVDEDEPDAGVVIVPRGALLWLIPGAVLFIAPALLNDGFAFTANLAGFMVGLAGGFALTGEISHHQPSPRRVLVTAAVALAVIVYRAVPVYGIADVRPEISRIIALEDKTAGVYQAALERVKKGTMSAEALAQFIDRSIVPELKAADDHLRSIRGVPPEHQPLVAGAEEYLRLRSESFRLYAEGWRSTNRLLRRQRRDGAVMSDAAWRTQIEAQFRANNAAHGKAEGTQSASLLALQKIKPSNN
jgi:membrane associated rhomboid family serine protease